MAAHLPLVGLDMWALHHQLFQEFPRPVFLFAYFRLLFPARSQFIAFAAVLLFVLSPRYGAWLKKLLSNMERPGGNGNPFFSVFPVSPRHTSRKMVFSGLSGFFISLDTVFLYHLLVAYDS